MTKNRIFRRITALLLALVMVIVPLMCASASAYEVTCPKIDIKGFMNAKLYATANDNTSEQLWPPTSDKILTLVKNLIGPLTKLSVNHDYDAFASSLTKELNTMLGDLQLDENGDVTDGSGAYMVYPAKEDVTRDGEYSFEFDWRIDPFEAAKQFSDFIEYIKDASGCDKVVIEAHSYAGIVTLCYFEQFGTDSVRSVCFNSTAVYGAGFTSEIIKGNLFIGGDSDLTGMGAESVVAYLLGTFSNNQYSEIIGTVIRMLSAAGLVDFLSDEINTIFKESSDTIYEDTVVPLFGLWPAIWSMIPDEDLEEGYNCIFNEYLAKTGKDYSGIQAKIAHYNDDIRSCREELLNGINDEINLYVVSRYGYSQIPLSASWQTMTDGVLDTESTSFGAQCSDYDSTAFDTSKASVSPNGQVDTSTCLFPEQTWMLRSIGHTQHYDDVIEMVNTLLYYDGQATTSTFSEYPQFMYYNSETSHLVADTGETKDNSFFGRIKRLLAQILSIITSIFKK